MDILLYLTELLQQRKTIGIVGLGTLYKKKSPGKYDIAKHAFVPPSYRLEFTTELKEQEALAHFISEKRKISIDSANYYIGEFVEKLQAQLAEQGEADLEPIGKLAQVNGELVFTADQESNFGHEFYGLPTLTELPLTTAAAVTPEEDTVSEAEEKDEPTSAAHTFEVAAAQDEPASPLEEVIEENRIEEENPGSENTEPSELDEQPVYNEIDEAPQPAVTSTVNEPVPTATTITEQQEETAAVPKATVPPVVNYNYMEETDDEDDDDDDDDRRPSRFLRFLFRFFIVLVLITIAGALTYFFFPQWFEHKFINRFNDENIENAVSVVPYDTTGTAIDSLKHTDSLTANNALVKLAKDSNALDSSKVIIYEVIGSAEKTQKRIDYVISTMKKRGIDAKPLKNVPGKLVKISLGTFTDYNKAKSYQDSLKIKLKNPQIYIQSIKPKN